mmetsp:Transcript_73334/g.153041  ORF Transcript_73334/g.153041 Transcript_73334/m.153041 type:complete len:117 (+) Transcript_73334:1-351(+)
MAVVVVVVERATEAAADFATDMDNEIGSELRQPMVMVPAVVVVEVAVAVAIAVCAVSSRVTTADPSTCGCGQGLVEKSVWAMVPGVVEEIGDDVGELTGARLEAQVLKHTWLLLPV